MLIEHDPDAPLSKVIGRMFGDERPKLSEAEKRERHLLKLGHPAPHMTKLLMDIGQDLVQESTYSDIVHAKNLPETPKNMETYKQVFRFFFPNFSDEHFNLLRSFFTPILIVLRKYSL